jgi:hemoglobin/transferrin/lactoferrin receptor protein
MKFSKLICLLAISSSLLAQEVKDTTYVHPKNFLLEEIVVSANRWEQNIREVPGCISKLSASLIQFQNSPTAADILSASNQVFVQKSQMGGGSPIIRGFASNRVLLVVDGVRMNNAIFRSGNVQNVISLDANTIEEAEIVFGPGSVIYGSDAIGGVMDFYTLTPWLADSTKALFKLNGLTRYASANNEMTNHIDVNVGFKKWAWVGSYTYSDFDDLRMGSKGPKEYLRSAYQERINGIDEVILNKDPKVQGSSGYTQHNTLHKFLVNPNDFVELQYSFQFSKTSDVPRYDRLILKNEDATFAYAEWYYGPQQWTMHSLQASVNRNTLLWDYARIILAYQDYRESRHTRNFGSTTRTNRFEEVSAFSVNVDVDKSINNLALYYGGEFVFNEVGSTAYRENINTGIRSLATTRYPNGALWKSVAGYMSARQKLTDKFLVNASVRLTHATTQATFNLDLFPFPFERVNVTNTAVNGSLGVVYLPVNTWKAYANLSTGFRAPNVDDIAKVFDSQPGNVVVPNPELKPEYAYNAEAGVVGKINSLLFDFAAYFTWLNNAIARAGATFNGEEFMEYDGVNSRVMSQQNISAVKIGGIQLGIHYQAFQQGLLKVNLNWQKGLEFYPDSTHAYSPTHVAPLFAAMHMVYTVNKLKLDVYAQYNSQITFNNLALSERADKHLYARDGKGSPYSPEWLTLNAKSSFQIADNVVVDMGIENIFDKRYRPYSSGISAAGRNVILALRVKL